LPEIEKRLGRQVLFRIVGSGDDMADLRILAEDCGVGASVQFLGGVGDAELVEIYQNCDLFIMPSRVCLLKDGSWTGEGFGIVYIEAAACGKPVIASNQGGAADAFIDGVTGVGVNPNSVQEIVDAVFTILSDPALGQRMGEDGRRFVESNFSMEAFSERIGDLVVGMST
jgi:phosphatidylinositol alpha-1,6-mannosyltransferase